MGNRISSFASSGKKESHDAQSPVKKEADSSQQPPQEALQAHKHNTTRTLTDEPTMTTSQETSRSSLEVPPKRQALKMSKQDERRLQQTNPHLFYEYDQAKKRHLAYRHTRLRWKQAKAKQTQATKETLQEVSSSMLHVETITNDSSPTHVVCASGLVDSEENELGVDAPSPMDLDTAPDCDQNILQQEEAIVVPLQEKAKTAVEEIPDWARQHGDSTTQTEKCVTASPMNAKAGEVKESQRITPRHRDAAAAVEESLTPRRMNVEPSTDLHPERVTAPTMPQVEKWPFIPDSLLASPLEESRVHQDMAIPEHVIVPFDFSTSHADLNASVDHNLSKQEAVSILPSPRAQNDTSARMHSKAYIEAGVVDAPCVRDSTLVSHAQGEPRSMPLDIYEAQANAMRANAPELLEMMRKAAESPDHMEDQPSDANLKPTKDTCGISNNRSGPSTVIKSAHSQPTTMAESVEDSESEETFVAVGEKESMNGCTYSIENLVEMMRKAAETPNYMKYQAHGMMADAILEPTVDSSGITDTHSESTTVTHKSAEDIDSDEDSTAIGKKESMDVETSIFDDMADEHLSTNSSRQSSDVVVPNFVKRRGLQNNFNMKDSNDETKRKPLSLSNMFAILRLDV